MRRYILYVLGLVLSIATIGCVKTDDGYGEQQGVVRLHLSNSTLTSRADDTTNDAANNEDLIVSAQVFFLGGDNSASAPVLHSSELITIGKKASASLSIALDNSQLDALFPNNKGYVYVIANYGSKIETTNNTTNTTTLAKLKALEISSSFNDGEVQSSFVMDSEPVSVTRSGNNLTVNYEEGKDYIELVRAAAKITLEVNIPGDIVKDGKTWTANIDKMKLSFFNGVKDGIIDDDSDVSPKAAQKDAVTFDIENLALAKIDGSENSYTHDVPFYSYSTMWDVKNSSDYEVYFKLAIPWGVTENGKTTHQIFYYLVPINASSLVRNTHYKLNLTVGVLGGLTEPVTVEPSYVVVDWGTNTVNVELSRPKYLVVDEKYVVMNNVTSHSVGYQSSDAVTAYIIGFKCTYYNGSTLNSVNQSYTVSQQKTYISDVAPNLTGATYQFSILLDETQKQVTLTHMLDNTMPDKVYHYFPYEITVRVTNTVTKAYEDITFVQYPAMYVDVISQTASSVYINGATTNDRSDDAWWHVNQSIGTANTVFGNTGKNMFTVSVSAFDSSTSGYIIGDPRVPAEDLTLWEYNTSTGANTNTKVNTFKDQANNNVIKEYRATIVGPTSEDIIAPKFIVASGYGAHSLQSNVYPNSSGKYRCASYQENGYPAGRWRVPTPAELKIIGKMCAEKKLESIFNNGTVYASSNGGYQYNTSGTFTESSTVSKSIRCVYDIWYWGDKLKDEYKNTFIWAAEGNIEDMKNTQDPNNPNQTLYEKYFTSVK